MMKKLLFIFSFLTIGTWTALSQDNQQLYSLDEINERRCRHNWNGMLAFSSWTSANLIAGTVGLLTTEGATKHFFEMNLYFNIINMAIAVPGIIAAKKGLNNYKGLSFEQTVKEVQKVKTTFLVNGVLDLSYITAGFLLREVGNNPNQSIENQHRFEGFGNAFILQGAWLLAFDFIEFGIQSANGKKLNEHWKNVRLVPQGLGMRLSYPLYITQSSPPDVFR